MNTTTVSLSVLALMIAGGIYFAMTHSDAPSATDTMPPAAELEENDDTLSPSKPTTITGSIGDLSTIGGSYRCEIQHDISDKTATASRGVAYTDKMRVRTDFISSLTNGQHIETHTITDGTWAYTWSPAMAQGMKMAVGSSSAEKISDTQNTNTTSQSDPSYQWRCDPWTVDESLFIPPPEVSFLDMKIPAIPASMPR